MLELQLYAACAHGSRDNLRAQSSLKLNIGVDIKNTCTNGDSSAWGKHEANRSVCKTHQINKKEHDKTYQQKNQSTNKGSREPSSQSKEERVLRWKTTDQVASDWPPGWVRPWAMDMVHHTARRPDMVPVRMRPSWLCVCVAPGVSAHGGGGAKGPDGLNGDDKPDLRNSRSLGLSHLVITGRLFTHLVSTDFGLIVFPRNPRPSVNWQIPQTASPSIDRCAPSRAAGRRGLRVNQFAADGGGDGDGGARAPAAPPRIKDSRGPPMPAPGPSRGRG